MKDNQDGVERCECSGKTLQNDAHVHHRIQRADDPDKALDLDNVEILNSDVHEKLHEEERKAAND